MLHSKAVLDEAIHKGAATAHLNPPRLLSEQQPNSQLGAGGSGRGNHPRVLHRVFRARGQKADPNSGRRSCVPPTQPVPSKCLLVPSTC